MREHKPLIVFWWIKIEGGLAPFFGPCSSQKRLNSSLHFYSNKILQNYKLSPAQRGEMLKKNHDLVSYAVIILTVRLQPSYVFLVWAMLDGRLIECQLRQISVQNIISRYRFGYSIYGSLFTVGECWGLFITCILFLTICYSRTIYRLQPLRHLATVRFHFFRRH